MTIITALRIMTAAAREVLDEAVNPDAVWLETVETKLSELDGFVEDENSRRQDADADARLEENRLIIFEAVAKLGVKISRQTLLTEYGGTSTSFGRLG